MINILSATEFSTPMLNQRIAILGLGAIGTLMAWHWRKQTLYGITRDNSRCKRTLIDQQHTAHRLTIPAWQSEAIDWLVITTKASATLDALQSVQDQLSQVQNILLLQNGMGQQQQVVDWLQTLEQAPKLWAGISTEGAYRQSAEQVVYAGSGDTHIGLWQAQEHTTSIPDGLTVVDDIQQRIRAKLAINAVINPLTAVFRCRNGELVENPVYKQKLEQLAEETQAFFESRDWQLPFALKQRAAEVAQATAANQSSTLQDILNRRPTELAYINGFLLRQIQQPQDLPLTRQLMQQLGEI